MSIETDPIAVAASPNRFNDIYWSSWWAVRFGAFFTERHDYDRRDSEAELAAASQGARAARQVLLDLEAAGWRPMFARSFGLRWTDQILAVVIQENVPWLVFSASNGSDESHVFALDTDGTPTYVGESLERFDWELQQTPPLRFQMRQH
jgi:hypothetical protein